MAGLDLGDLLTLVQTIAIIVALLTTLYFSRRQVQAFAVDLETRALNDIDDKFQRLTELFAERPQLVDVIAKGEGRGAEEPVAYYILSFCAHIFRLRSRGILGDNEWTGWRAWMQNAFRLGSIGRLWKAEQIGRWFDPAFRSFVERELLPVAPAAS